VVVANLLDNESVEFIYLLLPNTVELIQLDIDDPISPGEIIQTGFPWSYINKVIFVTDTGVVYCEAGFPASSNPDTLRVSLAKKEFGGVFDRVLGTIPIFFVNLSSINISSVYLIDYGTISDDILGCNPIMPGEILRLWVDNTDPFIILFLDSDGFISDSLVVSANSEEVPVYHITNRYFYSNGSLQTTDFPGYSFTAANCIPDEELISIEALDEFSNTILFLDLSNSPLGTWDRLTTQTDYPPSVLKCTASSGRTYTLESADPRTGCYDFDLRSLDFDFSFPESR